MLIFARIEKAFRQQLSPTHILSAPTISELGKLIRDNMWLNSEQILVPIRSAGNRAPLFVVNNGNCHVLYAQYLAESLRSDTPVYGLQPPALDGRHPIPTTIPTMAASYVSEMRRRFPNGPYNLAGHSFGGRVAFEMARQLVRDGFAVDFLGLVDTKLHASNEELDFPFSSAMLQPTSKPNDLNYSIRAPIQNGIRLLRKIKWDTIFGWLDIRRSWLHSPIPIAERRRFYRWLCNRANRDYSASVYSGKVVMFASAGNGETQKRDWQPFVIGGLDVHEIPVGHLEMIYPPYDKILGKHFDAYLTNTTS